MTPDQVDLATALKLLELPGTVGLHPENGENIIAQNGDFGPYIKCGSETVSLMADARSPLSITLEQAVELLKQPKVVAARIWRGCPATQRTWPLPWPVTGKTIELSQWAVWFVCDRWHDGTISPPRNSTAEEATLEESVRLLAERAAAGPSKRQPRKSSRKKGQKQPAKERRKKQRQRKA